MPISVKKNELDTTHFEVNGKISVKQFMNLQSVSLYPYIEEINLTKFQINTTYSVSVKGENFTKLSTVDVENNDSIISNVVVNNPQELSFDLTTSNVVGDYKLIISNDSFHSTYWNDEYNIELIDIPQGEEKFCRISTASGDNYVGEAFSNTFYNNNYKADKAFDDNNGTSHYSQYNQADNHTIGIVMNTVTLFSEIAVNTIYSSDSFGIETSNDTTNGLDGTWSLLENTTLNNSYHALPSGTIAKAIRIVAIEPINNTYVGFREIKIKARQ